MDPFDIFKQQESKLHEKPPEQVWKKLEKRLEQHRRRRPRRGLRKPELQLGAVALALLLILFAAVVVWWFVRNG